MKIKCPNCQAAYNIDGSALSDEGTYARCLKCENIFFLRKRSESEIKRARKREIGKRRRAMAKVSQHVEAGVGREGVADDEGFDSFTEAELESEFPDGIASDIGISEQEPEKEAEDSIKEKSIVKEADDGKKKTGPGRDDASDIATAPSIAVSPSTDTEPPPAPIDKNASGEDSSTIASDLQPDIDSALNENLPDTSKETVTRKSYDVVDTMSADSSQSQAERTQVEHTPEAHHATVEDKPPVEESGSTDLQDDIDALFSANAPADTPETAEPVPDAPADLAGLADSGGSASQDDVDALLSANAPADTPETAEPVPDAPADLAGLADSGGSASQDDIDALLSANAPADTPETAEPVPDAPADLAGLADPGGSASQDDVDALLADSRPSEEKSSVAQDVPDQADDESSPPTGEGDIDESSDNLAPGQDETEIISQDDIDALLVSADTEDETDEEEASPNETAIIHKEAEPEPTEEDTSEDELDSLLSGEDEDTGVDIFVEETSGDDSTSEEPTLDDVISEEEATSEFSREEDHDESMDEEILGIPSTSHSDSADEELDDFHMPEDEAESKQGIGASLSGLLSRLIKPIRQLAGKIPPLPLMRGKVFSSRFSVIAMAAAGVMLIALLGGGYWFFHGRAQPDRVDKVTQPAKNEAKDEGKTDETKAEEELLVDDLTTDAGEAKAPEINIGVFLPVEFDLEAIRIMSVTVNLVFESAEFRDDAYGRVFYSTVTVENAIETFFKDKFYTDTVFVQDKLEEFLMQSLKSSREIIGVKAVRLENLTFE